MSPDQPEPLPPPAPVNEDTPKDEPVLPRSAPPSPPVVAIKCEPETDIKTKPEAESEDIAARVESAEKDAGGSEVTTVTAETVAAAVSTSDASKNTLEVVDVVDKNVDNIDVVIKSEPPGSPGGNVATASVENTLDAASPKSPSGPDTGLDTPSSPPPSSSPPHLDTSQPVSIPSDMVVIKMEMDEGGRDSNPTPTRDEPVSQEKSMSSETS